MNFLKPNYKNISFHGRWQKTDEGMIGHWCRPYFEFKFTGTQLTIHTGNNNPFRITVGNNEYSSDGSGADITRHFPEVTTVNVKVKCVNTINPFILKGISHDGVIEPLPSKRKHNCLFIGDSLTQAGESHSTVIPQKFDYDYTIVAQGGMALCDGRGYGSVPECKSDQTRYGMESGFYFYNSPYQHVENVKYDFKCDEDFDMIFFNYGTNDRLITEEALPKFKETYVKFVKDIHERYPKADFYLLLPAADHESGLRLKTIEEAALEACKISPKIKYVSSRGWDIEIGADNVHPTPAGYKLYAEKVIEAIGLK